MKDFSFVCFILILYFIYKVHCAVAGSSSQNDINKLEDYDEPYDDLCGFPSCYCVNADDSHTIYQHGSNKSVNIYCSCATSSVDIIKLPSPLPLPPNTEHVQISNCNVHILPHPNVHTLTYRPFHFEITDATAVVIRNDASFWGDHVTLNNIEYIPQLPQGCIRSSSLKGREMQSIQINNVTIGLIETNAFASANIAHVFNISNCHILSINEFAFDVTLHDQNGIFMISNTQINEVISSGIQIAAPHVEIINTNFVNIKQHGFKVTALRFLFANCLVQNLFSYGFYVESYLAGFISNTFEFMYPHAMLAVQKLHKEGFNNVFSFDENIIVNAASGSLNSLWTPTTVSNNTFFNCTCDNMAWLMKIKKNDLNLTQVVKDYYDKLLSPTSNNICLTRDTKCQIPLSRFIQVLNPNNDTCAANLTFNDFCQHYYDINTTTATNFTKFLCIVSFILVIILN